MHIPVLPLSLRVVIWRFSVAVHVSGGGRRLLRSFFLYLESGKAAKKVDLPKQTARPGGAKCEVGPCTLADDPAPSFPRLLPRLRHPMLFCQPDVRTYGLRRRPWTRPRPVVSPLGYEEIEYTV
ncbi:hypothetical protein SODALDRAFT_218595 [Sodiomyces alkalinus F11]|uniref:Secreted protein n=1 Tax=Sodiomyces alkalinus (strain CBS 110278 / VKM F-3762 / F11) TaxID=1314773 RepID=A0A3N2PPE7_SODAK|nr:hypothetical protein SODALDRAFT_218595 [Sodiomyces alkalinus F11]ROT36387.1 hypothetical protein SODALDRAFT_218595 [Sodiomyces alkalinus F11]